MSEGLKELKRLPKAVKDTFKDSFNIIEKELKEYQEIKEIAKRYTWDDITSEIFNVKTDKKYRDLFNSAIDNIQEDYRKARALENIKLYLHPYCIAPNMYGGVRIWLTEDKEHYIDMPQEEYNSLKGILF